MPTVRTYRVKPSLPERLEPLRRIAYNLWWCWNPEAVDLFYSIDPDGWARHRSNPVALLTHVSQTELEGLARDDAFLSHMDAVATELDEYMSERGWFGRSFPNSDLRVAYFSMEFGINECLSIYSGGLGILAGDHLKSASDLGLPLIGVGLAYNQAWRQYLNADGWQQEAFPTNDFFNLPMTLMRDAEGREVRVQVEMPHGPVHVRAWRVQVGRVTLVVLDTAVEGNRIEDTVITSQIYGGDHETRIRQEMVLGIGGIRMLDALGLRPNVCHMNEGHSAFMGLERARVTQREAGLTWEEAWEAVTAGNVFTTHTPVPAGNDEFPADIVDRYLGPFRDLAGLRSDQVLDLGRVRPDSHANFAMPVLAIRMSDHYNGVSQLHGHVSRRMWNMLWPDVPRDEVPIGAITNGIHSASWIGRDMAGLYRRHLGVRYRLDPSDAITWERVSEVPDAELWRAHSAQREQLVSFAREHMRGALLARNAPTRDLSVADGALDPDALTIGFARRFATYKRAQLLFSDIERLARLVADTRRPLQIVMAGKAHPRDEPGKRILQQIVHAMRRPELLGRVVFLEDYDIRVGRNLVSGVDVWLNTPRRPLEASGTSGMKAAANGAINLSTLDGWWIEAYTPETGWAIGRGEEMTDHALQDSIEARALYDLLENEVVPLFHDRDRHGLPRGWIAKMKASIRTCAPYFNTHRMVREYCERFYVPSVGRWHRMVDDGTFGAKTLTAWKSRVRHAWREVRVLDVREVGPTEITVGSEVPIEVGVQLGALSPGEVAVEVVHGKLSAGGEFENRALVTLRHVQDLGGGRHSFEGALPGSLSGEHGYSVRLVPVHEMLSHHFEADLICWA